MELKEIADLVRRGIFSNEYFKLIAGSEVYTNPIECEFIADQIEEGLEIGDEPFWELKLKEEL